MPGIHLRRNGPNQSVERTATRRAFTFCVAGMRLLHGERDPSGRRSLHSR
jgi:hypothetical protein